MKTPGALLLILACCLRVASSQNYCYADDKNPYLNFSTKTAYDHEYNREGIPPVPGCKPLQMWLVCRHGTRYPGSHSIKWFQNLEIIRDQIVANYYEKKTTLCQEDVDNLKTWSFNMKKSEADQLTDQGRQDLYGMGQRFLSYFPELLNTSYSPKNFTFRHTKTNRTAESAEYFAKGVFGFNFNTPLPPAVAVDRLIQPYKICAAWLNFTKSKQEQNEFYDTQFAQEVLANVNYRLGLDNVSLETVLAMYDGCRFQASWNVTSVSPWCAVFSKSDLEVLEYAQDVKYYYKSGPGRVVNHRLACPLLRDLINKFSAVETQPDVKHPNALLYFTHDYMVDILGVGLGLASNPTPLTGHNYPQQQNRQFRSSRITPFAANIMAVLYRCTQGEPLQVMFYLSERPVDLPGCSGGRCAWADFKRRFAATVNASTCTDFDYCNSTKTSKADSALLVSTYLLSAILLTSALIYCR
ncbi:multiple inositol polyphosphate phosphatase 1-like [Homalodisca vitripennis]|uniref:multiple inositol polyphosphate phosphatase 1-like n=1 Tax=Homalodisca vitripennis TaxID=197043 RepID=UPI001EEC4581|nr:multiple inositol polyphosphate phosphatase 1-like [Homalodisca vitripennis]